MSFPAGEFSHNLHFSPVHLRMVCGISCEKTVSPAMYRSAASVYHILDKDTVQAENPEVITMKKKGVIFLIGAICYCLAPDLFAGPLDDTLIVLGSLMYSVLTTDKKKDPDYIKMDRDF